MCPFKPSRGKKPEISSEELKAKILQTARKHFAMHGMNGASLKEIAKESGIAGSLLNYHYKDKLGLFRACIETSAQDRMSAIKRILGEPRSRDEVRLRIELFVQEMISSMMADPHSFEIIDREVRSGNPEVLEMFKTTMLETFKAVAGFFKDAQERGFIRENANPIVLASILFTSSCEPARKEIISKRFFNLSFHDEGWRNEYAKNIVDTFMYGVLK